jgi:hypothetical protein
MDKKAKVLGMACLLGAQWACVPVGSDPADEVETEQSALKVNTDSAGNWQTYYQLAAYPAQRQITYCIAGVGPNPPQFPDAAFQTVIANAYAAVGAPWNRAGDVFITHGSDTGCGTSSSTTTVNVVYDTQPWPAGPGAGRALTNQGYPNYTAGIRTVRIGPRPSPSPTQQDYDWQAIHEFGHVLGFQDQCSAAGPGTGVADVDSDPLTIMENGCSPKPAPPQLPPPYLMSDLDRIDVAKAYGLPFSSLGAPSGITPAGNPAISTWGSNHFDVFMRGTDNHLYWKKTEDNGATWSAWQSLGGSIASAPAAVSWGPNRIDVFARGTANDLQHIYFTGTWSAWDPPLATNITAAPGVASWASGRLDVFYRSTAAQLHHKWYDNSTGWSSADDNWGGSIAGAPSAVSWASGRIDIVARNSSSHVVHYYWAGSPSPVWDDLGGSADQDPTISSWGTNRLDIFARQSDQTINHTSYDSGWAGNTMPPKWENLKGHVNSSPAAVSLRTLTGRINLAVLGYPGDVQFNYRDPVPGLPAGLAVYRPAPPRFQINCGDNGAFPPFVADTYSSGGSPKTRPDDITIGNTAVDPAPKDVYKSQRFGSSFTYTIPGFVANSAHVIRLHFAETNSLNNQIGKRVFSITVNGKPAVDNLDIYSKVGLFNAYIWEITQPANSSGQYVLKFTASADAATVSGIEII